MGFIDPGMLQRGNIELFSYCVEQLPSNRPSRRDRNICWFVPQSSHLFPAADRENKSDFLCR